MAQELLRVVSNSLLDFERQQQELLKQAREVQAQPFILGIADYIRKCYDSALWDRVELDNRMLRSLHQRMGEYEPEMVQELQNQGGNAVFMLLTQTKCRGAEAWMRDVLMSTGMIPWDMQPTPIPELSEDEVQNIMNQIHQYVQEIVTAEGIQPTESDLEELQDLAHRKIKQMRTDEAKQACEGMKKVISDQLHQGHFMKAMDAFLSDLTTYPFAVLKGPIITRHPVLKWVRDDKTGEHVQHVSEDLAPTFTCVSPYDFYWEPGITDIQNGFTVERHELSRRDLVNMKGQPGYNEEAVNLVLEDYDTGMLNEWLDVRYNELERRRLEYRRGSVQANLSPAPVFKALEFNGSVSGKMLAEWGKEDIEDLEKEYEVNAWLIGKHVVRVVLNSDPLFEKPYRVSTFNPIPNSIPGLSLPELIADTQQVANAAARAIVNNMAVASGPQVELNIDRLPDGEEVTELYPWKIWQMQTDPLGNNAPAVRFDQPTDNSASLMQIFEKFSRQADEQSGIPAYTYGDTDIQGAGRTASGLSMLMGSAGKGIRQIITGVDSKVIQPALRHVYRWNMQFNEDPSIKGDADVVMKGTSSLVKEELNLRRNEFLQVTANEIDSQIVGPKGRAHILREIAKGLELDTDKIIPSEQELELLDKFQRQMEMARQEAEVQAAGKDPQQDQISVAQGPDGTKKTTVKSAGMVSTSPGQQGAQQGQKGPVSIPTAGSTKRGNIQGYAQGGIVGEPAPGVQVDVEGIQNAAAVDSNKLIEGKMDALSKKVAQVFESVQKDVKKVQEDIPKSTEGEMSQILKMLKTLQQEVKEVKKVKTVKVVRNPDGQIVGLKG
jgi:hypothetical protein